MQLKFTAPGCSKHPYILRYKMCYIINKLNCILNKTFATQYRIPASVNCRTISYFWENF